MQKPLQRLYLSIGQFDNVTGTECAPASVCVEKHRTAFVSNKKYPDILHSVFCRERKSLLKRKNYKRAVESPFLFYCFDQVHGLWQGQIEAIYCLWQSNKQSPCVSMYLEEIILDGFKSYATRTVVSGWDSEFNAITGQNGSGKSNILDAICFVLGIDSPKRMRVDSMQDLIYKRGQAGITKASVTLIFNNTDKKNTPIGFKQNAQITVARQIFLGGKNKYLINGHLVLAKNIDSLFQSVNLNANNPTFLIMQGQITKILNMKPEETRAMIEESAGTRVFEQKKTRAEQVIDKKQEKVDEIARTMNTVIEPKLGRLGGERDKFFAYQKISAEYEQTKRAFEARKYFDFVQERADVTTRLEETTEETEQKQRSLEEAEIERKALAEEIKKDAEIRKSLRALEKKGEEARSELERKTIRQTTLTKGVAKDVKEAEQLTEDVVLLEKEASSYRNEIEEGKANIQKLVKKERDLYEEKEQIEALFGAMKGGASSIEKRLKEQEAALDKEIKEIGSTLDVLGREMAKKELEVSELREEHQKTEDRIRMLKEEIKAKPSFDDGEAVEEHETSLLLSKEALQARLNGMAQKRNKLEIKTQRASFGAGTKGVYGTIAGLVSLDETVKGREQALEVIAGAKLLNVVVDTEETAKRLLASGTLQTRVTFLPLNKIVPRVVPATKKTAATTFGGVEASDIISYPKEVESAVRFVFGGSFVCADKESAKKVAFDRASGQRAVTLEGDVYEPSGTLTGGSRANAMPLLMLLQEKKNICCEMQRLEGDVAKLNFQLQKILEQKRKHEQLSRGAGLLRQELDGLSAKKTAVTCEESERQYERLKRELIAMQERLQEKKVRKEALATEIKGGKGKPLGDAKRLETRLNVLASLENDNKREMADEKKRTDKNSIFLRECMKKEARNRKKLEMQKSDIDQAEAELRSLGNEIKQLKEEHRRLGLELAKTKEETAEGTQKEEREKTLSRKIGVLLQRFDELERDRKTLGERAAQLREKESRIKAVEEDGRGLLKEVKTKDLGRRLKQLEEVRKSQMKEINTKVMEMISGMEEKKQKLGEMLKTVKTDKAKIKTTLERLDVHKEEAFQRAWSAISDEFGKMFSILLPGCTSCLKTVDEGLEINVCLNGAWKESLGELSGGQRSLTALALILAMLKYNPSPLYILDEIDSALDLQHTHNIGKLFKTRFGNAQFIVVSLKEGMFENANTLFQTALRDGTSSIDIKRKTGQ
eukprot:GHVN01038867.1.p1 GENE.GHVN01038867.1~~GHVN01038867.1.p1  ORF type:complete len:1228 (+),score=209.98 GHVN01038867.1:8698-12381(+)